MSASEHAEQRIVTDEVGMSPPIRSTTIEGQLVQTGQTWRRKKDGKDVEIVWMSDWRGGLRVQLRKSGATNYKNTHWIDGWNLPLLYDLVAERPR